MSESARRRNGLDRGEQVAESLAAQLFGGDYPPGSYLPRETDLCTRFGLSRASVRTGLQQLTALGIITRIAGSGTVVNEYRDWDVLDPVVTRWMADYAMPNPEFLREIFEFRLAVEPFIASVAASRATAHDLVGMEEAFQGMERSLDGGDLSAGTEPFSEYDVAFHEAIYRATHNVVWTQLAHMLRPSIKLVISQSNDTADELQDSLARHRHLMDCIRLRRPQAAYDAALSVMSRTAYDLNLDASGNTMPAAVPARMPAR